MGHHAGEHQSKKFLINILCRSVCVPANGRLSIHHKHFLIKTFTEGRCIKVIHLPLRQDSRTMPKSIYIHIVRANNPFRCNTTQLVHAAECNRFLNWMPRPVIEAPFVSSTEFFSVHNINHLLRLMLINHSLIISTPRTGLQVAAKCITPN